MCFHFSDSSEFSLSRPLYSLIQISGSVLIFSIYLHELICLVVELINSYNLRKAAVLIYIVKTEHCSVPAFTKQKGRKFHLKSN